MQWLERGAALDPQDAVLQRAVVHARVRRDGLSVSFTLVCGNANYGQLGPEFLPDVKMGGQSVLARFKTFEGKSIAQLCGGKGAFCCLLANGEVYEWGRALNGNLLQEPRQIMALKGKRIVQVAAGVRHMLFLQNDGTLYAQGGFENGQLGVLTAESLSEPEPVAALASAAKITAIAAGYYHSLALTEKGELYSWGHAKGLPDSRLPTKVELVHGTVRYIAAGAFASAAITDDGRLWTWGVNTRHALGHVGEAAAVVPTPVTALAGLPVWRVALGKHVSAAVTSAGQLFVWGSNRAYPRVHAFGERHKLAPETLFPPTPTLVKSSTFKGEIDCVAVGKAFVAVLTTQGMLYTYGHNGFGQLGIGHASHVRYAAAFEPWSQALTPFRIASIAASHYNLFANAVATHGAYAASLLRVLELELFTEYEGFKKQKKKKNETHL